MTLFPAAAIDAQRPNIAVNSSRRGFPNPLRSDKGWGGGAKPWDIVDGERTYWNWARGLAFTGGIGNYGGLAGPRQATIDFGTPRTFAKVVLWHHGHDNAPGYQSLSRLDYWNGAAWVQIKAKRSFGRQEAGGAGSTSDEYEFFPVRGSRVRWSFDNRQLSMTGRQIRHGWLYGFEVYTQEPSLGRNTSRRGTPSPLQSNRGWGGGAKPWDLLDGQRTYASWARGLAFTGGRKPWVQRAGPRQATIDLGTLRTFARVILWHHGRDHAPGLTSLSQLAYWSGTSWVNIKAKRTFGRMSAGGAGSFSDEYEFAPVRGSKVRWSFDNRQKNVLGTQITHGWLYAFEIFTRSGRQVFGSGCSGSNGTPNLDSPTSGPAIGATFTVEVGALPAHAIAFGFVGLSSTSWNRTPLPIKLAGVGMPGCSLLVRPDVMTPLTTRLSPTQARWMLPIPNDPRLPGVEIFQQALVLDRAANAAGATLSNGSRAVIGWD